MTTLHRIALGDQLCRQIADPPGWSFSRWRAERRLKRALEERRIAVIKAEIAEIEDRARAIAPKEPERPPQPLQVVEPAPVPLTRTEEAQVLVVQLNQKLGRKPLLKEVLNHFPGLPKTTAHRALQRVS